MKRRFFIAISASAIISISSTELLAQEQEGVAVNKLPDYMEFISGSDSPNLIPDQTVYTSLSNLLVTNRFDECSKSNERGFSPVHRCLTIEGVDMFDAQALANEYLVYTKETQETFHREYCAAIDGDDSIVSRPAELASSLGNLDIQVARKKISYFEQRGEEILGLEGITTLINWANDNLRENIDIRNVDYSRMLEQAGFPARDYINGLCSAY